jgi:hypothetical protein
VERILPCGVALLKRTFFCPPNKLSTTFDLAKLAYSLHMAKQVTREQAERKRTQAAAFMDRIGQPDRAQEFDDMSTDEYAEQRGLRLSNPERKRRQMAARSSGPTKDDLQDTIDSAIATLDEAYTPESSREDLAAAIGEALETLRGEDEDDTDDDDSDDSGDDDSD